MLTAKQEKFAQLVADGCTQAEAYRQAYDVGEDTKPETIWRKACEVMQNGKVSARVKELKALIQERVTDEICFKRKDAFECYKRAFDLADLQQNPQAMKTCMDGIAKLLGLNEEKEATSLNVSIMPSVEINGNDLEIDIGEDANKSS